VKRLAKTVFFPDAPLKPDKNAVRHIPSSSRKPLGDRGQAPAFGGMRPFPRPADERGLTRWRMSAYKAGWRN